MATLSYPITHGDWSGTINLNYGISYDPTTNKSTITFGQCSAVYSSRADYQTSTDTEITVKAGDNGGSSGTLTLHTEGYGTGGTVTFTGTPSPASITVQHAAGAGAKTVSLSASTTAAVRPYSGSSLVYPEGSGSTTITSATVTPYTLTLDKGTGTNLVVDLYSSSFREPFSGLSSGATIYEGEVLRVWGSASSSEAYENFVMNVSGVGNVSTGTTVTVSGNITVKTTAQLKSYTLTINADANSLVTVKRGTETLTSGATVSHFDVLTISFSALAGYEVKSAVLNGGEITSPYTHEVTGSVDLTIVTALLSSAWIYVNGAFKRYFINIYIQGAWRRCREKIFSGGGGTQQAICGQALCGTIKCGGDT